MKRYEKYKPSGIEWIGEVPESWDTRRARFICQLWHGMSYTPKDIVSENEGVLVLRASNIQDNRFSFTDNVFIPRANIPAIKMVKKGDIVICSTNGSLALVGKSALAKEDMDCSFGSFMMLMRTNQNPTYIQYQLSQMVDLYRGLFSTTTINQLTMDMLNDFHFIIPPLAEQEEIAAYLDARCGDIDKVVATQEKRIALLNELKQSIITQAVTQGLNPDAKMKDSGVEWIGMVPEHWEIKKLKYHFYNYKAGPFGSSLITSKLLPEGDILVYTPEHIANQSADLVNNLYLPNEREDEMSQFIVTKGDIIFPIVGTLGRAMVINEDMPKGIINQRLAKFKIKDTLDVDFFMVLFADCDIYKQHIEANCRGSIIVNLTKELVGDIPIITPPKEEQIAIRRHLAFQCGKIDKQIKAVTRQIELLREYKQSLITEVVTGKRKVC